MIAAVADEAAPLAPAAAPAGPPNARSRAGPGGDALAGQRRVERLVQRVRRLAGGDRSVRGAVGRRLLDPHRPGARQAESPFGTTIAHGMLVRALVNRLNLPLTFEVTVFNNMVNYGSDRAALRRAGASAAARRSRARVKAVEAVRRACR